MKIQIVFDDNLIEKYSSKPSGSILMGIYLEHDGEVYPSNDWLDFGNVILGWWAHSISEMLEGRKGQDIDFMDGPFFISAHISDELLCLRSGDGKLSWDVDKFEFAKEVVSAANKVARKFHESGLMELSHHMNQVAALVKASLSRHYLDTHRNERKK